MYKQELVARVDERLVYPEGITQAVGWVFRREGDRDVWVTAPHE
jgi:hypothetical protein